MKSALLLVPLLLMASNSSDYVDSVTKWRAAYERGLKAPDGWLAVAGLFWLHEGVNSIGSGEKNEIRLPPRCEKLTGVIKFHDGRAEFLPHAGSVATLNGKPAPQHAVLQNDKDHPPDEIKIGDVTLTVIQRARRFAVRLRDPQAATVRNFKGGQWFPVDASYHIRAAWHAYPQPKQIPILSILGDTEPEPSPGYAQFRLNGKEYKLEPVIEEPNVLFFIFKDQTSAHETYGAGRFLKAEMPKDGAVVLDFNRAYNPPCAYIDFATCPLPPRQNHMDTRIAAGQKRYGDH